MAWETFQTSTDHNGFVFPMLPQARRNDQHHRLFRVNYGTSGILDGLYGTDEEGFAKARGKD